MSYSKTPALLVSLSFAFLILFPLPMQLFFAHPTMRHVMPRATRHRRARSPDESGFSRQALLSTVDDMRVAGMTILPTPNADRTTMITDDVNGGPRSEMAAGMNFQATIPLRAKRKGPSTISLLSFPTEEPSPHTFHQQAQSHFVLWSVVFEPTQTIVLLI